MYQTKTEHYKATKTAKCDTGRSYNPVFGNLYAKYRCEQSYFGYNPSVLKSGIQKYARRTEVNKGLWCLVEMDLFSLLEWDGPTLDAYLRKQPEESRANTQRRAKSIRSNMINRLVAMMSEEVSISSWWMPSKMLELYQKWTENRSNASSRKYLVDMYLFLTSQSMIRLISDLHSVFLLPPDYVKPKHIDDLEKIHCNIQTRYPQIYSDQSRVGKLKSDIGVSKYPAKLQPCVKGIIYNLEIGSDNVFYWIKKLYDLELEDGVYRNKYVRIVWDLLYRFIDRNKKYEFVRHTIWALQKFHSKMTHREKPIYLYHAVLLIVRRNEIDWASRPPSVDTPMADVAKLYGDHIVGGKMKIDNYVLDLHTKRMKWSAQCLENFAKVGAYIRHENEAFLDPEYREIYLLLKKELDLYHSRGRK